MKEKENINTSKFLSLVLRHKPEEIGLELDENGWANTEELIEKCNRKGQKLNVELLEAIVATNEKKRFALNEDKSKIRANQGHSIEVDLNLIEVIPPEELYHGTVKNGIDEILIHGLKKMNRQHVHLSKDVETAKIVGARRGKPIILKIDSKKMHEDNYKFYVSENGVWLSDFVPSQYIRKLK
jgi:putative RNA 2'-phosphotransferase